MAYVIEQKKVDISKMKELLPLKTVLKNGQKVQLIRSEEKHHEQMRVVLNGAIEEGGSYPQDHTLSPSQFEAYYLAGETFCVVPVDSDDESSQFSKDTVLGCFYIKPNFPGHCSHICNGGFLTKVEARRQGVASFMGKSYLVLAKILGYKASMFNLVFVSNIGSLNLWRSLGFKEIGRIPNAGYYENTGFVDAIQFYYDLDTIQLDEIRQ